MAAILFFSSFILSLILRSIKIVYFHQIFNHDSSFFTYFLYSFRNKYFKILFEQTPTTNHLLTLHKGDIWKSYSSSLRRRNIQLSSHLRQALRSQWPRSPSPPIPDSVNLPPRARRRRLLPFQGRPSGGAAADDADAAVGGGARGGVYASGAKTAYLWIRYEIRATNATAVWVHQVLDVMPVWRIKSRTPPFVARWMFF